MACPEWVIKTNREVPWWHEGLSRLRKRTHRLWNKARNRDKTCDRLGIPRETVHWDLYRSSRAKYCDEIKRSKRQRIFGIGFPRPESFLSINDDLVMRFISGTNIQRVFEVNI